MGEMQAIIEFSIELHKFVNVDLFSRGYYQIRIAHKINSKLVHKVEIGLTESSTRNGVLNFNSNASSASIVFPPCVINGAACSKTFQILYKNEEIVLNDVISIKTHLLVDAARCIEQIRKTKFILDVQLWWTDRDPPEHHSTIECVSSRELILHFDVCRGLHHHLPIIFDYFHLSAVTFSCHGSLITLTQPYIKKTKGRPLTTTASREMENYSAATEFTGYDVMLFGCPLSLITPATDSKEVLSLRYRRAQLVHWQLCSIILTAIQSLRRKLNEYVHLLPPLLQVKVQNLDINPSVSNLSHLAQQCYTSCVNQNNAKPASFDFLSYQNLSDLPEDFKPEDYITAVESDIAYLCGSAIVQWQQFIRVVLHNDRVVQHLAKTHHLQRIKRFAEAFFVVERPRSHLYSICDSSSSLFNDVSEQVRKSKYFKLLPRCDIECIALDGDCSSLPIIYEEKYEQEVTTSSGASAATTATSMTSLSDISFLEERFSNVSLAHSLSAEPNSFKRNLKEKLLTRLSFSSPSRHEYSSHRKETRSADGRRNSLPSDPTTQELIADAVTLLARQKKLDKGKSLDGKSQPLKQNEKSNSPRIHEVTSMQDIKNELKRATIGLSVSESNLADLTKSKKHRKKRVSLRTSRQFRGDADFMNKITESIIEEQEFEGTAYFPRPPNQFIEVNTDSSGDGGPSPASAPDPVTSGAEDKGDGSEVDSSAPQTPPPPPPPASSSKDECTFLEMIQCDNCMMCGEKECGCGVSEEDRSSAGLLRVSAINSDLLNFVQAKESFRKTLDSKTKAKGWNIYSDYPRLASRVPYFQCDFDLRAFCPEGLHLIICVHGLDGNSADLRLVRLYLELGLPTANLDFLMSQRNQGETFAGFEQLTDRLVHEINNHISVMRLNPTRISFIGHSMGAIVIRAALARPEMKQWLPKLYTFLSLSGPHLGISYNSSGLVNMGLWFMQKWKRSVSLLQLAMKDCSGDPRQSYLYKLSEESGLEHFRYILLCGSSQDHYVPLHSAHIELCGSALNDASSNGTAYREMVQNLLYPLRAGKTEVIRYDIHHALGSNANSFIGRAAHIAVLDSELFLEKFMVVSGLKYFV